VPASSDGVLTVTARPYAAVGVDIDWSPMWPGGVDRVNLIPTSGLSVSTWSVSGGAAVAYDTSVSAKITWASTAALGQSASRASIAVTAGVPHTVSVGIFVPADGSVGAAPAIRVVGGPVGNPVTVAGQLTISTVTWTPATSSASIAIVPTAAATAGWRCYADRPTLEVGSSVLSPPIASTTPGVLDVGPNLVLPVPWRTTVTRTIGSETVTVRSGDRAATPGGAGYVQDSELPLFGSATYRAVAWSGTGARLATSAPVLISLTAAAADDAILRGVDNPHLTQWVWISDPLDESWETDTEVFPVAPTAGAAVAPPVVWQQSAPQAMRGALRLAVQSRAEHDALVALLGSGTLMLCGSASHALTRDAIYLRVVKVTVDRPPIPDWSLRWLVASFVEVARPDTAGSPLMVPGWSYDVRDAAYPTYAAADAAYPSYRALAKGP